MVNVHQIKGAGVMSPRDAIVSIDGIIFPHGVHDKKGVKR